MATLHPLLRPYKPTADQPFDRVKAAHLLNRAGFGGTEAEIEKVMKLGPEDAVDWLFDFPDAGAEEQSQTDVPDLSSIEGYPAELPRDPAEDARHDARGADGSTARCSCAPTARRSWRPAAWWLKRMAYGPHPLQEKLTLFWHGHFTTSARTSGRRC